MLLDVSTTVCARVYRKHTYYLAEFSCRIVKALYNVVDCVDDSRINPIVSDVTEVGGDGESSKDERKT